MLAVSLYLYHYEPVSSAPAERYGCWRCPGPIQSQGRSNSASLNGTGATARSSQWPGCRAAESQVAGISCVDTTVGNHQLREGPKRAIEHYRIHYLLLGLQGAPGHQQPSSKLQADGNTASHPAFKRVLPRFKRGSQCSSFNWSRR
jgi:hypothetical protein